MYLFESPREPIFETKSVYCGGLRRKQTSGEVNVKFTQRERPGAIQISTMQSQVLSKPSGRQHKTTSWTQNLYFQDEIWYLLNCSIVKISHS